MTWRKFWITFSAVQLAGIALSSAGVLLLGFYGAILGMILLFPGLLISSQLGIPQDRLYTVPVGIVLTLALNVIFWAAFARPRRQPKNSN